MRSFAAGYEHVARIVLMVFVTNVAFVVHTVLGLVLAGFFPSVAATYSTYRTWALTADKSWTVRQTWHAFHRAWRDELISANVFGWPQLVVWLLLAWDYYLANWNDMGRVGIAVSGALLLANALYGLFVLVSWAVRANFDEKPWWLVRVSLHMVIARPLCSLIVVALWGITAWAWVTWPGILMTFGFAAPIFVVVMTISFFGRLPGMDDGIGLRSTRSTRADSPTRTATGSGT